MDAIVTWLWDVSVWHWFALAVVLVVFEIAAPTTFLLGPAAAAVLLGLAVAIAPELDWRWQLLVYAVLAVIFTVVAQRLLRQRKGEAEPVAALNQRSQSYVGRRFHLDEALPDGRGRMKVDDTWWQVTAQGGASLAAGTPVEVVGFDGAVLTVRVV